MELHVVIDGDKDLTGQLLRQLREAIHNGRLAAGEKLPPSRLLAEQLGLSRKTVNEAYSRLVYDNLLVARVGSGTYVAEKALRGLPEVRRTDFAGGEVLARWQRQEARLSRAFSR